MRFGKETRFVQRAQGRAEMRTAVDHPQRARERVHGAGGGYENAALRQRREL